MDDKTLSLRRLLTRYHDSEKDIFLHPNTSSILEDARANADYSLTSQDVLDYRASLYNISRSVEARELRGQRRYESTRKWECYGPGIQYNTIHYNTKQYTIQYNTHCFSGIFDTIQYNTQTIRFDTIQYNTIQFVTIQYNTIFVTIQVDIRYNTIQIQYKYKYNTINTIHNTFF